MTLVVLILTGGMVFLSLSQVALIYLFLSHLKVAPKLRLPKNEVNKFESDANYLDISEIPAEMGLEALKKI